MRIRTAYDGFNGKPRLLHSDNLEDRFLPDGVDVLINVLDWSLTNIRGRLVGSHKIWKAKDEIEHIIESKKKNKNAFVRDRKAYALILTSGSAGPAFDIFAQEYYPDEVLVVQLNKKFKDLIQTGIKLNGKGPSIEIKTPDYWFEKGELKEFWIDLFYPERASRKPRDYRRMLEKYRNSPNFRRLCEIVAENPLHLENVFDVTNVIDYSKGNPYVDIKELNGAVKDYHHLFYPFGSGETGEAARRIRENSKGIFRRPAKLLAITAPGNPSSTDPFGEGDADKFEMPRDNEQNIYTRKRMDSESLFFTAPRKELNMAKGILDAVVKRDPDFDVRTGNSASAAFVPFLLAEPYKRGLRIPAYRFGGFFGNKIIEQPYIIKSGESVCVLHSGEEVGKYEKKVLESAVLK